MARERDRWRRIDQLFHDALSVADAERVAYVEARGGGDAVLVAEVLALLGAHGQTHVLLDAPRIADLPGGMRVGPYALERMIGSGGMATVYLARRADQQFEKLVAVKLVNQGLASAITDDRFQTERHILARLEHPHIARLLDAGLSEFGQPYLVMEWVDGVSVDRWIAEDNPTRDQRLDLWLDVADAVSYAHRNLIVHRDVKPSNVLVSREGVAKLVDFGIAKLLEHCEGQMLTQTLRLTPLYASPEQLRGEPVSTATDVYSLGLLLCEMVTGVHPFGGGERTPHAAAAALLIEDPTISAEVPADLSAIIRMALRKEPERRYTTVTAFGDDVRRFRRGLPVIAQPDSLAYTVRRFVDRHRVGVIVALAVAVAILVSVGAAVWQARAAARQATVAAAERDRANLEARKTAQINAFLQDMLRSADPTRQGRDVRVADVLDRANAGVLPTLGNQPEIEASIRATLAATYQRLGLLDPALRQARRALAVREQTAGAGDPDLARSLLGEDHAKVILTRTSLANLFWMKKDYRRGEPFARAALQSAGRGLPVGHPLAAYAEVVLGQTLTDAGRAREGEPHLRRALRMRRALLGPRHWLVANTESVLGGCLAAQRRFAEAERLLLESYRTLVADRGPEHDKTRDARQRLLRFYRAQGRHTEAAHYTSQD